MEQFKEIVLETPPDGMHYSTIQKDDGSLIVRLVPSESVSSQNSEISSKSEDVEKFTDNVEYFTKITAEDREKVKEWVKTQTGKTEREKKFLDRVKKAVQVVDYDYWIANLEPSVSEGKIYYAKGKNVGIGFSCNQWKQMAKEFIPERGSRLAKLHELFIWYALRIANGLWTLSFVADDSSSAGNYWNAPNSAKCMEETGARECGGYHDGQGNTYKSVTVEDGYALVGGDYYDDGDGCPVAYVCYYYYPNCTLIYSSGVLVLTK